MEPRALLYQVAGVGDPLVLVPGGLTGWLSWLPHVVYLQQTCQPIRVQPIHNERGSAGVPGDPEYTAEVERESLRLTMEAIGLETAHFAGWSSGGRSLIEFAHVYPERVRTMTLIEPAANWILEELGEAEDDETAFLYELAGNEVTEDDLAHFVVVAGFAETPDDAREHPGWGAWTDHRMALSWQSHSLQHPEMKLADLSSVTASTMLVKGSDSADVPRQIVDVLSERLPNARVLELEGDHACHIQSIDRFVAELEDHAGLKTSE